METSSMNIYGSLESANNDLCEELARYDDMAIVDVKVLAKAFGVSNRTIRRMVDRYELPPCLPLAGRSRWMIKSIKQWLEYAAERVENEARKQHEKILKLS